MEAKYFKAAARKQVRLLLQRRQLFEKEY
jgi:hypothetical protein